MGDVAVWEVGSCARIALRNFKVWDLGACPMALQVQVPALERIYRLKLLYLPLHFLTHKIDFTGLSCYLGVFSE